MAPRLNHSSIGQTFGTHQSVAFGGADRAHPSMHFLSPGAISNESISAFDEYAANPRFQELRTELRSLLFTGAQSTVPTREQTPEAEERTHMSSIQPRHRRLLGHLINSQDHIPMSQIVKYLNIWVSECAPWLDMFDQERHFGIEVPCLAQTSSAVFYALLALSARQMERQAGITASSQDSLEFYSEAISSLTPALNANEPYVIVTACILCALEMMSASPRDWRRHVEGCASLFAAFGVNGFSGGLLQAVFWCYARMDLCGAIIADGAESTVLPIDKWVLLEALTPNAPGPTHRARLVNEAFLMRSRQTSDMHANYAVYLCAKVLDLLSRRTRYVELGEENGCVSHAFQEAWTQLWDELQHWSDQRAPEMLPVKTVAGSAETQHFPKVLFAHWAAISSNQLYHTACILMLEIKAADIDHARKLVAHSTLWHARRVVGISLTNPHPGCLNNAIQPLYVAGKLFTH